MVVNRVSAPASVAPSVVSAGVMPRAEAEAATTDPGPSSVDIEVDLDIATDWLGLKGEDVGGVTGLVLSTVCSGLGLTAARVGEGSFIVAAMAVLVLLVMLAGSEAVRLERVGLKRASIRGLNREVWRDVPVDEECAASSS